MVLFEAGFSAAVFSAVVFSSLAAAGAVPAVLKRSVFSSPRAAPLFAVKVPAILT